MTDLKGLHQPGERANALSQLRRLHAEAMHEVEAARNLLSRYGDDARTASGLQLRLNYANTKRDGLLVAIQIIEALEKDT